MPPSRWPAFKSWISEPETEHATQTTAATPSTAATPARPVTPMVTISSAEISSADRVSPDSGWFELPTMPTRYPPTAESTNPVTDITSAATIAGIHPPVKK